MGVSRDLCHPFRDYPKEKTVFYDGSPKFWMRPPTLCMKLLKSSLKNSGQNMCVCGVQQQCVFPQLRVHLVSWCKFGLGPPGALARATFNMRNRFLELPPHTTVQCNTPLPPSLSLPPSCVTCYLNSLRWTAQKRVSLKIWRL